MTTTDQATKLAQRLEAAAESAIDWCAQILNTPIDLENGMLLRSQSSAALTALNTQLRADALRLRAQRADKALETLLKTIAAKEQTVPKVLQKSRTVSQGSLDGEATSV